MKAPLRLLLACALALPLTALGAPDRAGSFLEPSVAEAKGKKGKRGKGWHRGGRGWKHARGAWRFHFHAMHPARWQRWERAPSRVYRTERLPPPRDYVGDADDFDERDERADDDRRAPRLEDREQRYGGPGRRAEQARELANITAERDREIDKARQEYERELAKIDREALAEPDPAKVKQKGELVQQADAKYRELLEKAATKFREESAMLRDE
jgi:hypothetical protein